MDYEMEHDIPLTRWVSADARPRTGTLIFPFPLTVVVMDRNTRRFPKKTFEGRQIHTIRKHQRKEFIPVPPKLKRAIQLMYRLLRLTHHLGKVTTKIEGNQPVTFKRLTSLLSNTIRPAFPNRTVTQMIQGSAMNWSYTTQLALKQHYEDQIESTLQEIKEETDNTDWAHAIEISSDWAQKNYGEKIGNDVIERTEALLTAEMGDGNPPTRTQTVQVNAGASTSGSRSYAQVVASTPISLFPPQIIAHPKPTVQNMEVQTSPNLITLAPGADTSRRGDWSFDEEENTDDNPLDPNKILQPVQVLSLPPKEKRVTRPKRVQIVLPEDAPAPRESTPSHGGSPSKNPVEQGETTPPRDVSPPRDLAPFCGIPIEKGKSSKSVIQMHTFEEVEEMDQEDSPQNRPFTQMDPRQTDYSSPSSVVLFSDSDEEPVKCPSPLTVFLQAAGESPFHFLPQKVTEEDKQSENIVPTQEQRPTQADIAVDATENAESGPVQADGSFIEADNMAARPTQISRDIGPLNKAAIINIALDAARKDRENPPGKEPTGGKRSSKEKHLTRSDQTPVTSLPPHKSSDAKQPHKVQQSSTRHANTSNKSTDWSLTLHKKLAIIGDSNVSRLPQNNYSDLQIDSFPGAKWQHAAYLLEQAIIVVEPQKLILAFGLNNRQQRYRFTALTELQKAKKAAAARLPNTEILIPIINFSPLLPPAEETMVEALNGHIRREGNYIPALPREQFQVEKDGIHWRASTAKAIFDHWCTYLNC
ncbi:hypothetical protein DPX16_3276 [Anabarilius grahami]|uniref:Uncharacterized protein n=1 Tax=Anabarilius grahami TaxID=495550 RepID=A0A3N0XMN4_ANAGA|nr:hypothetical protein DPX16_3276 [Anabarilius grahami]